MYKEKHTTDKASYGDFQVRDGKVLFQRIGAMNAQRQHNLSAPVGRGVWAFPWPIFEYFYVSASYSSPHQKAPKNIRDDKGDYTYVPLSKKDAIVIRKRMKGLERRVEQLIAKKIQDSFVDKYDVMQLKEDIEEMKKGLETGQIAKSILWDHKDRFEVPEVKKRLIWWGGDIYSRFGPRGFEDPCICSRGWYKWSRATDYISSLRKQLLSFHKDTWSDNGKSMISVVSGIKSSRREFNLSADHLEVFLGM